MARKRLKAYSDEIEQLMLRHYEQLSEKDQRHYLAVEATKNGSPYWEVVYFETFESRSLAVQREYKIKKMKSRKYIVSLIDNYPSD